ncbi:gem-associated protein 2 [Galendromus occidentalis]|uniref:Gem-associated protein 2 n=1 Tax=Galendromus occidentalis TaxID=34638 RepID=A0AAJ6QRS4_9ACAR|nr:gem-associated protein 2 [Galendromus occidentalis]
MREMKVPGENDIDSSDSEEEIKRPAIPFEDDGKPIDETQAPLTGSEYLRRVHREAKLCAKVCVAQIPDSKRRPVTRHIPVDEKAPPPDGFNPEMEWQLARLAHFSDTRQRFAIAREFSRASPGSSSSKLEARPHWFNYIHKEMRQPLVSFVTSLSGKQILSVLEYHIDWIQTEFTKQHGLWIFSMLVALEKPLSPHACDIIRSLARSASKVRAQLDPSRTEDIISLNLIVCLISRYFSQMDLCD